MTTIIVTHEDNEIDEFEFDDVDQIVSIGRRSTNDVCIPNLSVSGMHARITIDGDSALLEDNNSTNGTYVNGRLISRQLINNDDEIVIGKARVLVLIGDSQWPENPNKAKVMDDSLDDSMSLDSIGHDSEPPLDPPMLRAANASHVSGDASMDESATHAADLEMAADLDMDDGDDSYVGSPGRNSQSYNPQGPAPHLNGADDDHPMTLSEKAKLALGRQGSSRVGAAGAAAGVVASGAAAAASRAFAGDHENDTAVADAPTVARQVGDNIADDAIVDNAKELISADAHPLDGLDSPIHSEAPEEPFAEQRIGQEPTKTNVKQSGAVIEIQNGAKSGQVLPIDKPVTTLGRPGIQIAAIMRKPDGYFLMHIESDDSVDMPTLNHDMIGDEPVLLSSGDRLNVAGIDVEFMLS